MKATHILTGIMIMLLPFVTHGQQADQLIKEAREFYELEQYARAASWLQEAMNLEEADDELHYLLAECYRQTFHYEDAIIYYKKVAYSDPEGFPLSYYYLGLMEKYVGDCSRSILSLDQFIRRFENEKSLYFYIEQAYVEQAGCRFAMEESAEESYGVTLLDGPVNSEYNDFATVHIADTSIVLTSARPGRKRGYDARFGESFTDIYFFGLDQSTWTDQTKEQARSLNNKYHDGSGSYCALLKEFYFTQCGLDGPHCKIYRSRREDNEWTDPEPLSGTINLKGYDTKQPAISMTGDTLYFVSDRPGGKGGADIWFSIRDSDRFGPPANLGPSVNTSLNEASPHPTPFHNLLLFSSNGHQGYGGYDLFLARRLSGGDTTLVNIGPPFNTSYDDLYPELHHEDFFFSSNRPGGPGNFDIYSVETGRPLVFLSRLNATRRSAKRSEVKLVSRRSESLREDLFTMILEDRIEYEQLSTDEKRAVDQLVAGDYEEELLDEFSLADQNSLMRFADRRKQLLSDSGRIVHKIDQHLVNASNSYIIRGRIKSLKGSELNDIQLYIKDAEGEIIMISGISKDGSFQFNNIQFDDGYRIESDLLPTDLQREIMLENISYDPFMHKLQTTENVYFDLDRYSIRPEAEVFLHNLADRLRKDDDAQLEIFAFTDDTGTETYNMILSKNRAEAVRNYLVEAGVGPHQLMINPQGEEYPDERRTALQRQLSRRVSFKVYNLFVDRFEQQGICFTRYPMSHSELLKNMPVEEDVLIELNGELPESFRSFQPVRVPGKVSSNEILYCEPEEETSH